MTKQTRWARFKEWFWGTEARAARHKEMVEAVKRGIAHDLENQLEYEAVRQRKDFEDMKDAMSEALQGWPLAPPQRELVFVLTEQRAIEVGAQVFGVCAAMAEETGRSEYPPFDAGVGEIEKSRHQKLCFGLGMEVSARAEWIRLWGISNGP